MHEAGLVADLMRRVLEAAQSGGASRVVGVSVRLGPLSHMSATHFAEHFALAAAGTAAESARLDVHVSEDINDPRAGDIVLESVEFEAPIP